MRAWTWILALAAAIAQASAADVEGWTAGMEAGRKAYLKRDFPAAASLYAKAVTDALAEPPDEGRALTSLRQLAAVQRLGGEHQEARKTLERALAITERLQGPASVAFADTCIDMAAVLRALTLYGEAKPYVEKAIAARSQALGATHIDLARDLAMYAQLAGDLQEADVAKQHYRQALVIIERSAGADSPRLLPLLDLLGGAYRNENNYAEAEPFYSRALLIREATFGLEDAELIANLDNLAYVLFGLKRYDEAEPLYTRLLAVWEKSASPEHPMVAVTADKLREFYAAQGRYDDAEPYAARALALRLKAHLDSLQRRGALDVARSNFGTAEKLYRRALAIADDAQAPDEFVLPPLQTLSALMKQMKRPAEAESLDRRIKLMLAAKGDREGRRTPPPVAPKSGTGRRGAAEDSAVPARTPAARIKSNQ